MTIQKRPKSLCPDFDEIDWEVENDTIRILENPKKHKQEVKKMTSKNSDDQEQQK